MERGHLHRITSPAHRYLLAGGVEKPEVRRQYLRDLRERWMLYKDPLERHQKFRIFAGRLVELHVAEWLELHDWTVYGLEALREGPDIEASSGDRRPTAFEVKFTGTEDHDFGLILKSLAGDSAAKSVSPYDAANYLLFRVYEAAKQLQRVACRRVAVLVVEELTWFRFEAQLSDGWIDWANPRFLRGHAWEGFLASQRARYPDLPNDLRPALGSLDELWIVRQSAGYHYHREYEVGLQRA